MSIVRRASFGVWAAALLSAGVGGCGGAGSTASLGLPAAPSLPKMPELPKIADLPSLPAVHGHSPEPPTEAYARVARGATTCWFGAGGQLKRSYIFYADADPPSAGGKAEIALLERTAVPETPRGARTYRIAFLPEGSGTQLDYINHKMSDETAVALQADVARFLKGDLTCAKSGPTAPQNDVPVAVPVAPQAKAKLAQARSAAVKGK